MTTPHFDGQTYDHARDHSRLESQLADVRKVMGDGHWHSLYDLEVWTYHPQASISARIRDLRKVRFGGHIIERRYVRAGIWEYRMVLPRGQLSLGLM